MFRLLVALSVGFGGVAAVANAQFTTERQPAEFPPETYTASQYVDSEGCVFVRAGIGGVTSWVPRVNRSREPLCGFEPSLTIADRVAMTPEFPDELIIEIPQLQLPAAEAMPMESDDVAASPAAETVAAVEDAEPQLRLSEVCDGKSGVLSGFRVKETGEPVDCGPVEPQAVVAMSPPAALEPVSQGPSLAHGSMIGLQEICADIEATGREYILASGGALNCEALTSGRRYRVVSIGGIAPLVADEAAVTPAQLAAPAPRDRLATSAIARGACRYEIGSVDEYLTGGNGVPFRCVPQDVLPYDKNSSGTAEAPTSSNTSRTASRAPVAVPSVPEGYEPVWTDGRLNPQRGIPEAAASSSEVSSKAAGNMIQVGVFAVSANAQRAISALQSAGLPVQRGSLQRDGKTLHVIQAGPIGGTGVAAALRSVRDLGYRDAFVR